MALAHVRNGKLIKRYNESRGWVRLEDGRWLSHPVEGLVDGNDRIVPVVEETVGTPGPNTETTVTRTVEADRYHILTTIRNLTPQEIAARDAAEADAVEQEFFAGVSRESTAVMMTLRDALKAVRNGNLNGLTDDQITNQLRTRFRTNYESLQ